MKQSEPETIVIPRKLQLEIAHCSAEVSKRQAREMKRRRTKLIQELREMGLNNRELGELLGLSLQYIWRVFPDKRKKEPKP
jgi:hypothetical protein